MHRWIVATLLALYASAAFAKGERAGEFDYYVLALSWSPNWCAYEGDAKGSAQCDGTGDFGWILHGLWPQYERGYPSYCNSRGWNPSHAETNAMADIMATGGLAWHQWKKHGRCTDLAYSDYFALSRQAYAKITRPAVFRQLDKSVRLPASVVEDAFLKENQSLEADMVTITCKAGHIQEARICLTKELEFRTCGADVIRDCDMTRAVFDPVR